MFPKSFNAARRFCIRRRGAVLAAGIVAAVGSLPAMGAVPMDKVGFTAYLAHAFAEALPGYDVKIVAPLAIEVHGARNDPADAELFYLENIYSFCRRGPENCDSAVATHVSQMTASLKDRKAPLARSRLRAVVRPVAYVEAIRRNLNGKGEPIAVPLIGDLWAVCMLDLPTAMQVMKPSDLEPLELTRDAALELCKQNVAAELPPIESVMQKDESGKVGIIYANNPYESSRLLFPESWVSLAKRMAGHLIVAAPEYHTVLFADDRDAEAVATMLIDIHEIGAKAARPLPPMILGWTPSGWRIVAFQRQ